MTTPTHIVDGCGGTKSKACVTTNGQLITAPYAYDDVMSIELATANTGYSFFDPKHGKQFVITGFYLKADKQVSSTVEADVVIYESDNENDTTVDKALFSVSVLQFDQISLSPLNLLVNVGKFVNAKTTDDDIHMTIFGYYIPEIG
jgi:hypothetical protein